MMKSKSISPGGRAMGKVIVNLSMSLDGFIAGPNDEVDHVFKWFSVGDTDVQASTGDTELRFKFSPQSRQLFEERISTVGAVVTGRRLFDVARAWGGKHPANVPVFVVTHHPPQEWVNKADSPFTFVTDGVASAVEQARKAAGDKHINVGGADIARQCLKAGLLNEIQIDLVPVLLGNGIRLFEPLGIEPVELETTTVIEAPGVTHLHFRVAK
jgi:dihydrofolate reductase